MGDCSNGATGKLAKMIFPKVVKNVKFICTSNNGLKINENCGALHPEKLCEKVVENKADIGFAFDGDGDRIIISDEKGRVLDGDDILYLLCCHFKSEKAVVGTTMTNKGLEDALSKRNISLLRSDVGDKYVASLMRENNLSLGGETSGHIIISDISKTGDGIACALLLIRLLSEKNVPISKIIDYQKYPQINTKIPLQDKFRIINCVKLRKESLEIQKIFGGEGRVIVRASGTENKIRIMCEHKKSDIAKKYSSILEQIVKSLT